VKVGVITLGCDKNTVDTERYVARLGGAGVSYTAELSEADVILVNTCGFIDAAKQESIDALIQAGRFKEEGSCRAVVALGCMVQRHEAELREALPEVDLFLGSSQVDRLLPELEERGLLDASAEPHPGERVYTGALPHVRYLKVSEGCDHGCAFCAIPLMRGRHRSFSLDEVVREAQLLELQGARELNLVAQDLAHYGRDIPGGARLPDLLEALIAETSVPWIRMLYLYSAGITPRLLDVMARNPRIVPYLDMPMQHASDEVLKRMRRPERRDSIRQRMASVRAAVPDVAIRTTCIVGFPGETDEDFESLLEFLAEVRFERVGAFTYSPQEGTRAYEMVDDVPDAIKRDRLERLTELQRAITVERYEERIGRVVRAIVDRPASEEAPSQARVIWQADDIDGVTWLEDSTLPPGTIVDMTLEEVVDDFDFRGRLVRAIDMPVSVAPATRRPLPLAATTIGSYGR
jgi:ribosomal protein S12 methylthiotransferase